jgi:mono/diheme cytochrome c family protein
MNAVAPTLLVSGLLLFCFAAERGTDAPRPDGSPITASVPVADPALDQALNDVVDEYCVRCHSERRLTGNLSLEDFDVASPQDKAQIAERVIHKVRAGMMPPVGARRPPEDSLNLLVTNLEHTLDEAAAANPNPGRRTFQRLTRSDYEASIREMFGLRVDASAFLPNETISESFDNIADVQMLSATLMEGYLKAAAYVSRAAVGDPEASPSSAVFKVDKTLSQMRHVEGTPFGTRGGTAVYHTFPADGDYVFQIDLHAIPTGQLYGSTSTDEQLEISINGERVAVLNIDRWATESDPTGLRMETPPIHVLAGQHRVAAAFIQKIEGPVIDLITPVDYTLADSQIGSDYGVTTAPHLRDLVITGPFRATGVSNTESRSRIFTCRPTSPSEERPCAESIVSRLGQQAYRRPLDRDDLESLMAFYDRGREDGGFERGVRMAVQAMLASPHFVFRLEESRAGDSELYQISDVDLASRLSFFLWAAPPDEELIRVASEGRLSDDAVLEQQVGRMLADPRAESLATRFASQWLRLQDVYKIHPDAQHFPYFDHTLTLAMERETQLLFHYLVQEDRSVMDLLTADYTFVNERLARHYEIPGVSGTEFRKVSIPNPERRGLLGHGSILMMTSHANQTSPVQRGKWVMEVLLGSPPPAPPPVVPALDEVATAQNGRELTTRERMEQHRSNPACLSCHSVIDPIGLALDNFDVTGAWRIKENGNLIDASGELYDGSPIQGASGLRETILKRPTVFVRTFTRNMMAYAIGRRVEYYDMPTVRRIEADAATNDFKMSSFILGVVKSPAFRMARAETVAERDAR